MKKKKIIGTDLDDVLLNFNDALYGYHNAQYGTAFTRKDMNQWHLDKIWGFTKEESIKRVMDFYLSPDHAKVLPIPGSVEAIRTLSKDHTIYIITSKPELLRDMTTVWLGKYFPGMFKALYFTNQFDGKGTRTKAELCKELSIECFVEDSLDNAGSIAKTGIPVFLLDTPWNQGKTEPLVTRVNSWDEIVREI